MVLALFEFMGFCSIILVVWLIYLVGQAFSKRPLSLYQTQWGCVGSFSWWMQSSQKCWTGWRSNPTPFGTGSIKWWMQRGFYQTFMQKQNGGKTQQRWEGVKKAPGVEFNHSRWSGSWVCCWGWLDESHPQAEELFRMWGKLLQILKLKGYVPNTSIVLLDVEENKEERNFYIAVVKN